MSPSPFLRGRYQRHSHRNRSGPFYSGGGKPIQILGNVANLIPGAEQANVSHYNIAPVLDIYGNVVNSDLRSVSDGITQIIAQHRKDLPRGSQSSFAARCRP